MSDTCPNCGAPITTFVGDREPICSVKNGINACEYAAGLRAAYEREKQARLRLSEQNADLQAERDRYRKALEHIDQRIMEGYGIDRPVNVVNDIDGIAREALGDTQP